MDPLIKSVSQFIYRERLLPAGARVIVGLSGGADSVALLALLTSCGFKCIAAHCNFHLRADESNRDERHAHSIAAQLDVPIETVHFNVSEYIERQPRPTSIEMACRDLRYDWFEKLRVAHCADSIAVAHNSDDNAETMLLNLIRGTGIAGARGMLPRSNRNIIRPLLETTRAEIEEYLRRNNLQFITDSTNLQNLFTRNRLRLDVLPSLYSRFPSARSGLQKSLSHLRKADQFLRDSIEKRMQPFVDNDTVNILSLTQSEPDAEYILYEYFRNMGLSYSQSEDICSNPNRNGARFPISSNKELLMTHGKLQVIKSDAVISPTFPPLEELFEITIHPISEFKPSGSKDEAYFDASILQAGTLNVRSWRHADRLRPFGMKGTRAVSDIFNSARIPLQLRKSIPLLCLDNEILWIPSIRASRLYTVTSTSISFLRIRIRPEAQSLINR